MEQILITPRSYGKYDSSVLETIRKAGYQPILNPYGQILTRQQMKESLKACVGVIVGVDPLDAEILSCAPRLRAVSKYGVGTDNIDLAYCTAHGIPVTVTKGANTNAVADCAFALLCACARRLPYINARCHEKDWKKVMGLDICGKKLGILGLGAIGKGVARRASGFDMTVLAYDVFWDGDYAAKQGIRYALPDEIFETCDFISLHLPLTEQTKELVNADAFRKMKKNAIVINTARGGLIEETALISALRENRIAGAGIDVFNEEPPENPALYTLDNLLMGSHCAASTEGASETMSKMATDNLLNCLRNCPPENTD